MAADLAETLSGPGPYTVFAPTDAAFAALLVELGLTKAELLANKALLAEVLIYHVVPGTVPSSQVPVGEAITTVQGGIFTVEDAGSGLEIIDGRNRSSDLVAALFGEGTLLARIVYVLVGVAALYGFITATRVAKRS